MKTLLKAALARAGYVLQRRPRPLLKTPSAALRFDLSYILAHLLLRHPKPFVVQVGAYDGVANEPLRDYIRRFQLPALLIEPQPDAFARLAANYADQPQVALCCNAVADADGPRELYQLNSSTPELPDWAGQTATFRKEVLLSHRHAIADLDRYITAQVVQCRTFDSLFRKHDVARVDVLQVDTEGYDYEILKLFPFDRYLPLLVRYEHFHLSVADQDACLRMLTRLGYALHVPDHAGEDYMDTIGYRPPVAWADPSF
jgi:FkbM family methyltransferase